MADATAEIERFAGTLDLSTAQMQDVTKALIALSGATRSSVNAANSQANASREVETAFDRASNSLKGFGQTMMSTAVGMGTLVSSVYDSNRALSAMIPVLDSMQRIVQSGISVVTSLISAGASLLSPGIAKIVDALGTGANALIDVIGGVVRNQIQMTQTMIDSFETVARTGMMFSGSVDNARKAASDAGMSLRTFAQFASKNVATLSALQGNAEMSAKEVARMGKNLGLSNGALLVMYGGFEHLSTAVADYLQMQTLAGTDAVKNQKELAAGAKNYLLNQKELSNLTGKSAEALKREQEERMKVAAFQAKYGEMTTEQRATVDTMLARAKQLYGPEMEKYLMEKIANEGEIISKVGLSLQAFAPQLTSVGDQLYQALGQTPDQFKESMSRIVADNASAIKDLQNQYRDVLRIQAAGYGPEILNMLNNVVSAAVSGYSQQVNAIEAQRQARISREGAAGAGGPTTALAADAIVRLEKFKIKIEDITAESLPNLKTAVDLSYKALDVFAEGVRATGLVLQAINGNVDPLLKYLGLGKKGLELIQPASPAELENDPEKKAAIERAQRKKGQPRVPYDERYDPNSPNSLEGTLARNNGTMPVTVADPSVAAIGQAVGNALANRQTPPPAGPNPAETNMDKKAKGGIVKSPSIVGEDGPEAVIPLAGGKIPLDINFDPIAKTMDQNNSLTREMLDAIRDMLDVQRRILDASY